MFIELTDHLRCPNDHQEAFLVLLPERMDGREVVAGHLGCPVCGWSTDWDRSGLEFDEVDAQTEEPPPFDAEAAIALLSLDGPGGWLALVGRMSFLAKEIAHLLPGVGIVAVNPPENFITVESVSVVYSTAWPIKSHSMRAVAIGADASSMASRAIASVLPGLRALGEADAPEDSPTHSLLQSAPGIWLVKKG